MSFISLTTFLMGAAQYVLIIILGAGIVRHRVMLAYFRDYFSFIKSPPDYNQQDNGYGFRLTVNAGRVVIAMGILGIVHVFFTTMVIILNSRNL